MTKKKVTEAHSGDLRKGESIPIGEIGKDSAGIDPVSENDHAKAIDDEVFANQMLTIVIATSNDKEDLTIVTPSVNGVNQPIVRGVESQIKRKYVEALARCTYTRYEQKTPDPSKPDKIQMIERISLVYPFSVLHDPHPNGREWLKDILKAA